MDLALDKMYDTFKNDIWKELGPLDTNWFEILTAQATIDEGNVPDKDEFCVNQEGDFKAPLDKTTIESQLFSTPKVFRHSRIVSPEPEDEQSAAPQEKGTLSWAMTQSPFFFHGSRQGVAGADCPGVECRNEESLDLLNSQYKTSVSYAKQISESLGAQINPDISWTSSLNTPTAIPSTLILSKTEESLCPASDSPDKNVVIVRKLFPSLSKSSSMEEPQNTDISSVSQDAAFPSADGCPISPLNKTAGVWQQKSSGTTKGGCCTVGTVPEEAENTKLNYFANSSSALRKVKSKRTQRKQIIETKVNICSSKDASKLPPNICTDERLVCLESGSLPSTPVAKAGDTAISQWSPLSLSGMAPSDVDGNMCRERLQTDIDSIQTTALSLKTTERGLVKKRRKFIYRVSTLKTQSNGRDDQPYKRDLSQQILDSGHRVEYKQLDNIPKEAACLTTLSNSIQNPEADEKSTTCSVGTKLQDLDMSQLCKDFAQDFTQIMESNDRADSQSNFSPAACLSAMKQAKEKAKLSNGCDTRRHISTRSHHLSISESTVVDSGFQSGVTEISHITTSSIGLPPVGITGTNGQSVDFKTLSNAIIPLASTDAENMNVPLVMEPDIREQACDYSKQKGSPLKMNEEVQLRFSEGTVARSTRVPLNGQIKDNQPEKPSTFVPSVNIPGFRTASNKDIQISSANLEKAKCLFEDCDDKMTASPSINIDPSTKHQAALKSIASNSNQLNSTLCNNSGYLSASEKADVTELCSLLEEADSQFEFTQFKSTNLKPHSHDEALFSQKIVKELDPEFLAGIDFDDSFSSDGGKDPTLTCIQDKTGVLDGLKTPITNSISQSTDGAMSSASKNENLSATTFSENMSIENRPPMFHEPITLPRDELLQTSKPESNCDGVVFRTAGGNILTVSKKCLSKAKAMFADLEGSLTDQKSLKKQSSETVSKAEHGIHSEKKLKASEDNCQVDEESLSSSISLNKRVSSCLDEKNTTGLKNITISRTICPSGFKMASGKGIFIPNKYMEKADALFKDSNVVSQNEMEQTKDSAESIDCEKIFSRYKNRQHKISEEHVPGFTPSENVNVGLISCQPKEASVDNVKTDSDKEALKNGDGSTFSMPQTSKNISSFVGLSACDGFITASGRKVSVSADAMKRAECIFNEIHPPEERPNNKNIPRMEHTKNEALKLDICEFQVPAGKNVTSVLTTQKKPTVSHCKRNKNDRTIPSLHLSDSVPASDPSFRSCGFIVASGKAVVCSSPALQNPEAFFSDISLCPGTISESGKLRIEKEPKDIQSNEEKMHCDWKTAERVLVSQNNTSKATNLFSENDSQFAEEMQDEPIFLKDKCRKEVAVHASNELKNKQPLKKVEQGTKIDTLEKAAKEFSQNINEQVELKSLSFPHKSGFQTASGKRVQVSSEALKKAKSVLSDYEVAGKSTRSLQPSAPLLKDGGSCPVRAQAGTLSSEALEDTKSFFSDICFDTGNASILPTKKQNTITEKKIYGFSTASGAKVHVTQKNLMKAKLLFKKLDNSPSRKEGLETETLFKDNDITNLSLCEHDTVNRTLLQIDQKGTKKKSEAPQNLFMEEAQKHKATKQDKPFPQSVGFQTASGKAVIVSSEALLKANFVLNENESSLEKTSSSLSKSPLLTEPSPLNCDFTGHGGKPVTFLSEDLKKAKDVSIDLCSTKIPLKTCGANQEVAQKTTPKIPCGFTTARGAKVGVTEMGLLKANKLLREFVDGDGRQSVLAKIQQDQILKTSVEDTGKASICDVTLTSDGVVHSDGRTSHENDSFTAISHTEKLKDSHDEKMISSDKISEFFKTDEPSTLITLNSLNLTGCTETQQMFLAQEALDCTKALLEDEVLAGQNLSMNSAKFFPKDSESSNKSTEENKGGRKRLVSDWDLAGEPPSKRRLLEEFDRSIDGPRFLQPLKSCPNSLMKDRSVFKYSVSHDPNVTKPNRDEKNYMNFRFQNRLSEPSIPGSDGTSGSSKKMTFVPPFIKNSTRNMLKTPEVKDHTKIPAFVPPFKKQTSLRESSLKQGDKKAAVVESKSKMFVPPTKKTQSPTGAGDLINAEKKINICPNASLNCGLSSSAEKQSHTGETNSTSHLDFHQNIELARDMQDMRIGKKKRQTIRPLPGGLYLSKTSGIKRIQLKDAVSGRKPARCTPEELYRYGVHKHVSDITSETAEAFRFNLLLFFKRDTLLACGGVQLGDGGWLIPSSDWTTGKEEFLKALCDTPGVDPKLISEEWVNNHYRWIVWKQASMERSFPQTLGSQCLTPEQVLLQLKYRYDVEVDHSCRPALRKIMEKDDTAAKTLVLCVCGIVSRGNSPDKQKSYVDVKTPQSTRPKVESSAVVWLTDGWYAIKAQLDEPLTALLSNGRLAVGGKMIIHGAHLVGSQDACSPLEAPDSLMLKICANSSRRARWDAKLGFHRDPRPFLLPVSCLYSNGGPVGCVDIIILRSYPIQWMERKADGAVVFRSARAEEKEARRYHSHKQKAMETLFAKIQAEFEEEEKGNINPKQKRKTINQDISSLHYGEELYEAVGDDPSCFETRLSEQQLEALHGYRRSLMEKRQGELQDRYRRALEAADYKTVCPERDVTPVWRLCVADSKAKSSNVYQLNLWRPPPDLQSLLKEGCRYKVYNLVASGGKKRSGVETLQLTGTKKTQFQDLQAPQEWLSTYFQPRISTDFLDLQNPEFKPLCGEVDLVGYAVRVIHEQGSSPAFYLADEKLNFVKVRCFSSLSQAGLEDVVKPRVLLALSNLQLRGQSMLPTPVVFSGDLTSFSTNPKETHLQESISQLKNFIQCQQNFFVRAEEKLSALLQHDGLNSNTSLYLQPQTPVTATECKQELKTNVTFQRPIKSLGSFTPGNKTPPAETSSAEKDPRSLKRKQALDYLFRIPSPPPLSHLSATVSPCVKKTFNPPRRSGPPSTSKTVPSPAKKPVESMEEDEWVNDEELAMIDTQALHVGDSTQV